MVCKDLTFIHLGNDTKIEGLINFEKLRMLAKEVKIFSDKFEIDQSTKNVIQIQTRNQTYYFN